MAPSLAALETRFRGDLLAQLLPHGTYPIRQLVQPLTYQAIVE